MKRVISLDQPGIERKDVPLLEQTEGTRKALEVMQEANRIFENFPVSKYALYTLAFLAQVALCFYVGLKI